MPRWWTIALGLPVVSRLDPRALSPRVMWCFVGVLAWAAVSLIWSPVLYGGVLPLFLLLLLFGVAMAGAGLTDRDAVLMAFAAGLGVSCLISISQRLGYSPVVENSPPAGLFYNSEVLAEVAAPMFVWCFWKKLWPLAALMTVPLALCHSRLALVVAAVGLIAGLRGRLRLALLCLVAVGGVVLLVASGMGKAYSADERILLWGTALRSITFFGRGLGWWFQAHPFGQEEFVHSDLLQAFVELGIGGLFLAAVPIAIFAHDCECKGDHGGRLWCHLRRKGCFRAERAAFLGCCVEGVASFPLHLPAEGFLFALLAGILARRGDGVYAHGLPRRTLYRAHLRRLAAYAAAMVEWRRFGGAEFSVRSAFAEHADVDTFGSRKSTAVTSCPA